MGTSVDVFNSVPGSVLVSSKIADSGFHARFEVNGAKLSTQESYATLRSIVTSVSINESSNFQFMQTLKNVAYLYTFGDKISEIDINGIAFINSHCDGNSGFTNISAFFNKYKLSNNGTPIDVSLVSFSKGPKDSSSTKSFKAFLGSFNIAITDASVSYAQFSLKLYFMPPGAQ